MSVNPALPRAHGSSLKRCCPHLVLRAMRDDRLVHVKGVI